MTAFDYAGVMWAEATRDGDAEAQQELLLRGKLATAAFWPFLAAAESVAEFGHRLALIEDRVAAAVPEPVLEPVLASVTSDWKALNESRQEAARTAASELGERIRENTAQVIAAQVQSDQQFFDRQSGQWVTAASVSAHKLPGKYTVPEDIAGNSSAVEGYRDARYHAANDYDWRHADGDSFSLQHRDYQQGYGRAHDDLKTGSGRGKRAYIDPTDAQRYNHYPDMNPPVENGPLQGADGFVTGGEGDAGRSDAVIQQRQLTPGQWTVTPGTEWPVRPNAGDPAQVPRTAGFKMQAVLIPGPKLTPQQKQHVLNAFPYRWTHENGAAERNHGGPDRAPTMPKISDEEWVNSHAFHFVQDGSRLHGGNRHAEPYYGDDDRKESSRHQAGEGIVPTPGPNPNYFSQGSEGISGPPTFPENPSSAIEPKTDNRIDDLYGAVPPQVSSGSAQGLVDGQGYSRQVPGSSATAGRRPFVSEGGGAKVTAADALPGDPVPTAHPDHQPIVPPWAGYPWCTCGFKQKAPQGKTLAEHLREFDPTYGQSKQAAGFTGEHVQRYVDWAQGQGHDPDEVSTLKTYQKEPGVGRAHVDHIADQLYIGGGDSDWRKWGSKQAVTDGRIVGHCDNCNHPVRYHTGENGVDELRHLHNNHNRCSTGQKTANLRRSTAFFDPKDASVRVLADGMSRQRPTLDNPSGAGDEFDANTWDNAVAQRPMQSAQDRGINTPTSPREPIGTVSSEPGRADDDNRNQNGMARETALAGRSIEDLMEV